jgi:hypothetical protein
LLVNGIDFCFLKDQRTQSLRKCSSQFSKLILSLFLTETGKFYDKHTIRKDSFSSIWNFVYFWNKIQIKLQTLRSFTGFSYLENFWTATVLRKLRSNNFSENSIWIITRKIWG